MDNVSKIRQGYIPVDLHFQKQAAAEFGQQATVCPPQLSVISRRRCPGSPKFSVLLWGHQPSNQHSALTLVRISRQAIERKTFS